MQSLHIRHPLVVTFSDTIKKSKHFVSSFLGLNSVSNDINNRNDISHFHTHRRAREKKEDGHRKWATRPCDKLSHAVE